MPQKSTFFYPEADVRPALPPGVTDVARACRAARDDVARVLVELPGRAEREPVVGAGEGGDETTAIDAAAERVILERFRGEDVRLVSEEAGLSGDGRWTVVVDPIDGSLNAKRGIPFFSLSIAVADGETMDDVVFGYVYDFGSGEEWTATRGGGALLERRGRSSSVRRTSSRSSRSRRPRPRTCRRTPRASTASRTGCA